MNEIERKQCRQCGELKELSEYYTQNLTRADGTKYIYYNPKCKRCVSDNALKRMYENYDEFLVYMNQLHKQPKYKEKARIVQNKPEIKASRKKWRQENKHKVKQHNEQYQHKSHDITKEEWKRCREYFNYTCAYCGIDEDEAKEAYDNYLHKEHVDHIGSNDLSNCVPACKSCNSSKGTQDFSYWFKNESNTYTIDRYEKIIKWLEEDFKKYILI